MGSKVAIAGDSDDWLNTSERLRRTHERLTQAIVELTQTLDAIHKSHRKDEEWAERMVDEVTGRKKRTKRTKR